MASISVRGAARWHGRVGSDELELGAGRVGGCREAAVGAVLGSHHDRATEVDDFCQRGVGVVDPEVDRPVGRDAVRKEAGGIHDPGQPALALLEGGVAELWGVAEDMGVPAEHGAVEVDGDLVVPGVQLEPVRCTRFVEDAEALVAAGLSDADPGAAGAADEGHGPEVTDSHSGMWTWPALAASRVFWASSVAR
jgi:hypothetical protein